MTTDLPAGPLYPGYFADPFVLQVDGRYYAYGTGLHGQADVRAFEVLSSPDLRQWTSHGGVLEPLSAEKRDYWAPEVAVQGDTFYLYYSVGQGDQSHHLRVATARHPLGPFADTGQNLTPAEPFAIDPHPFQDQDGAWWLFYARDDLGGERPGTVLAVAPLHEMTRLGEAQTILRASGDWQRYQAGRPMYGGVYDWHTLEGPFVRYRDGQYHLLYSGGAWINDSYGVGHAVAAHPLGPWREPQPGANVLHTTPVLIGPGHASVTTLEDQDVLIFHAWDDAHTRRQLHAAPLRWEEGGPRAQVAPSAPVDTALPSE
ncbi:glycoside hydrolase family 43 protein [Deinococcus sp.]|uniref:glycoside hydrolase family 43 protein n=1 Tax=Deinococcus sp. TaxID=47478 RepID=UPI003B5C281D